MKKMKTRIAALLGALALTAWGIGMAGCSHDSGGSSGGGGGENLGESFEFSGYKWKLVKATKAVEKDGVLTVSQSEIGVTMQLDDSELPALYEQYPEGFAVTAVVRPTNIGSLSGEKLTSQGEGDSGSDFALASHIGKTTDNKDSWYAFSINTNGRTQLGDAWKMKGRQFGSLLTDESGTIFTSVIDESYTIRLEYNDDGTTAGRINGIRQAQDNKSKYTPQSAAKVVRSATNGSYGFVNDKVREFELYSFKVHALNEGLATVNLAPEGGNIATLKDGFGNAYVFLKSSAYTTRLEKAPVTFTVTATDDEGEDALDAVTVTSDAPSVAMAELSDGTLTITPVSVGFAAITVKNGDVQRVISVTVKEPIAYTDTDYGTTTAFYPANGTAGVYEDDHLKITFDGTPAFVEGSIDIYEESDLDDPVVSIPVDSIVVNTISDGSKSQNYNLKYFMAQIDGNTVEIIPTCDSLENGKKYVVGIGNGVITGKVNGKDFTGFDPEQKRWSFTVRGSKPTPGASITVGASSNAHFRTVQGALKAVTGNATISVEKGTYREILYYTKAYDITIEGKGTADFGTDVVIVGINCNEYNGTSATRGVFSWNSNNSLTFKNVTLQNAMDRNTMISGDSSQSETLYFNGKYLAAYNSSFKGFQDTLLINKGRAWFYKCYVEGDTDFIWGSADAALFEECEIVQLDTSADSKKTSGSYVFETRVSNENNSTVGKGYVLFNSKLDAKHKSSYLARRASSATTSGNYYDQSAFINVTVTGKLSGAFGGNEHPVFIAPDAGGNQHVGIKYYNDGNKGNLDSKLFDSSLFAGKVSNKKYEGTITAAVYNAEYSGRNVILNRVYNKVSKEYENLPNTSIWDIAALAAEFGAGASGELEQDVFNEKSAKVTWDFASAWTGDDSTTTKYEGKNGKIIGTVNGSDAYMVKMYVNATNGKFETQPSSNRTQIRAGTVLTVPVTNGSIVSVTTYNSSGTFGIEGETTTTYTHSGDKTGIVIYCTAEGYITEVAVSKLDLTALDDGLKNATATGSVRAITLGDSAKEIMNGNTYKLNVTQYTSYDASDGTVSWKTDNAAVASVSNDGTVTANASSGTATITATVNGHSATCNITAVPKTEVSKYTFDFRTSSDIAASADEDSSKSVSVKSGSMKIHSATYGAVTSGASVMTVPVFASCTITVYQSYNAGSNATLSVTDATPTSVTFATSCDNKDDAALEKNKYVFTYSGSGGTADLNFSAGSMYVAKIVVEKTN